MCACTPLYDFKQVPTFFLLFPPNFIHIYSFRPPLLFAHLSSQSMLSDAVVAKAHFESKHESKKVPLPDGWAEAAAAGRNKGKKGKKDGKK